ncbi:DUF2147 domain-containing protein [Rhodosalinus halophilus]|uniref:DUF2147 domain-containing protein n=1 Tax=Rhodosalinus halophilus TaxID=2259333 RepID=A0A365UB66_9RHOB|nr:DUF2147 domain-containing protein [Rhodosalinus halophilus]RBI86171.1 DUF2147 domain-containing protein [Rhodosalinus halophilus]
MQFRRALFGAAFGLAGAAAADPVLGTWQTEVDDGGCAHVEMRRCGEAVCGVVTRTFDAEGEYLSETLGEMLVRGMVSQGGGRYEGRVWHPANDRVYPGRTERSGDRLRLKGCVAGGLVCASQTWARVRRAV